MCHLQLGEINLLIFDEAHHCVKKNPYNCIMSEFYHDARFKVGQDLLDSPASCYAPGCAR